MLGWHSMMWAMAFAMRRVVSGLGEPCSPRERG